ncbi:MAG: SAM-dependent methyltransferase [Bacteroidetes bacterium]|nr:MAG: SAM-dependent methyltransferase [Bacteroidota bacterium]
MSQKQDDIKIVTTQDGSHSLFSQQFGEQYHSKYGAILESRHVFIEAGLFYKFSSSDEVNVLEIGFGSGLNAFLSYLESVNRPKKIYYETMEAFPVSEPDALKLNYPEQLMAEDHASIFQQMHRLPWDAVHQLSPNFHFKKVLKKFEELKESARFDVVYFDAFAPGTQPELWENSMLSLVYEAMRPKGVLVTYSAKGSVKRNLKSLGFQVENIPGPPGKREMIRAIK